MPNRTRTLVPPRPARLWLAPAAAPVVERRNHRSRLAQPLAAAEFWKRLGL